MSSMNDIKYLATIEYEIFRNVNNYNYPHEKFVNLISNMIDTCNLIKNLKNKKKELECLISDDE